VFAQIIYSFKAVEDKELIHEIVESFLALTMLFILAYAQTSGKIMGTVTDQAAKAIWIGVKDFDDPIAN
jgi:hypothetical protein